MNVTDEEAFETPVVLAFGYNLRIVISMKAAIKIVAILSEENVLKCDTNYLSATSSSTSTLVPWGTEDVNIAMISKAEILLRCAAGEKK